MLNDSHVNSPSIGGGKIRPPQRATRWAVREQCDRSPYGAGGLPWTLTRAQASESEQLEAAAKAGEVQPAVLEQGGLHGLELGHAVGPAVVRGVPALPVLDGQHAVGRAARPRAR